MIQPPVPSIPPREAAAATDPSASDRATQPLIVDVREPDEFAQARIDGVVLVPISQFVARHAELPKDRPLLMVCASGSRSTSATMYLLQAGWPDVRNVTGGMLGWQAAGLPVRTGPPDPGEGDLPA
ncbi:MAG TPA: rhodanese-like domain-containing protein [Patescibacteria group bacterium]|nr:rhodanese-like domain-containing protein [Patescibacteria group bacterium]